jgi:hypothetical protein
MRPIPPALAAGVLVAAKLSAAALPQPVASYRISCRYEEASRTIEGQELLTWTNTTRRPAASLRFHLDLNAYRSTRSTYFRESGGDPLAGRGGAWGDLSLSRMTDASGADLLANSRYVRPDDGNPEDRTVLEVTLDRPVAPGTTMQISIEFVSRLPMLRDGAGWRRDFLLAAGWFPRIGVLADSGWISHQRHAGAAPLSDFGSWDVTIDLPAKYTGKVGGTGRLLEEREAPGGRVLEHFRLGIANDFAWTADTSYQVIADRYRRSDASGVDLTLLLQPGSRSRAARYLNAARAMLAALEHRFGRYPFGSLTIADVPWDARRASGRSYPALVLCRAPLLSPDGSRELERGIARGVARQFVADAVAPDELEEPWLSAGLADYAAGAALDEVYGAAHPVLAVFGLPIVLESVDLRPPVGIRLGALGAELPRRRWPGAGDLRPVAERSALAFSTLEGLAGKPAFGRILRQYVSEFRFSHPRTADFLAVARRLTGAAWVESFGAALVSPDLVDYAVAGADTRPAQAAAGLLDLQGRMTEMPAGRPASGFDSRVLVVRRGSIALPVEIRLRFAGARTYRTTWDARSRWIRLRVDGGPRLLEAAVDPKRRIALDAQPSNNGIRLRSDAAAANLWTARAYFWAENALDLFMELW